MVHKSFFTRIGFMFRLKIRNNHPVFSIFLRNTGTNFTAHQRLICVLTAFATCVALNALFYGHTFKTPVNESTTNVFVTAVAAAVPFLGKMFFQKHKLHLHDTDKDKGITKRNRLNKRVSYHVGCNFLCFPCKS